MKKDLISMFEYRGLYSSIKSEILASLEAVLSSGTLLLGKQLTNFESTFSEHLSMPEPGIGVASGTDALIICMLALGIAPGSKVLTVSNTAVATVSAIKAVGGIPVFADIVPSTGLMDLEHASHVLKQHPDISAIIVVHLFGSAVDVKKLKSKLLSNDIKIIEDCAQAFGTKIDGEFAGTLGDAAAFSFYPTKNLGCYGDGGMCLTRNASLADEMRVIRQYGFNNNRTEALRYGINSRLDEMQASILGVKIKYVTEMIQIRRVIADRYRESLHPKVIALDVPGNIDHSYHLFVVQVDNREKLRNVLAKAGISTGIHYSFPIHMMRAFKTCESQSFQLIHTEKFMNNIISLPIHPELNYDDVCRVIDETNQFYR